MNEPPVNQTAAVSKPQPETAARVEIHPASPQGCELLASYASYSEAQAAVDRLSDAEFPVENTTIVMRDLIFVEQVTGRLTWGRVLANGLFSGGLIGIFIGLFFGIFLINPFAWGSMLLWSLAAGAVIGAVIALVGYWASAGKRDFESVGAMKGGRYDLYVVAEFLDKAREILDSFGRPRAAGVSNRPGAPR